MGYARSIYFIFLFIGLGCTNIEDDIPECVQNRIQTIKKDNCIDKMSEYEFNGRLVYVYGYSYDLCDGADFGSNVIDEKCNDICFLGGIAGNTTCEEVEFHENATFIRDVWRR